MLYCFQWAAWNSKDFNTYTTLNPQVTLRNLDEWARRNEAYYLLYERALRGHSKNSNRIMKNWMKGLIKKASDIEKIKNFVPP